MIAVVPHYEDEGIYTTVTGKPLYKCPWLGGEDQTSVLILRRRTKYILVYMCFNHRNTLEQTVGGAHPTDDSQVKRWGFL